MNTQETTSNAPAQEKSNLLPPWMDAAIRKHFADIEARNRAVEMFSATNQNPSSHTQ